jgi:choline dehydrogenase-like flavoprotein
MQSHSSVGIQAPKISYRLGQNSEKIMAFAVAQAREAISTAGAVEIFVNPQLRLSGYNFMGTAAIGNSSADSVVHGTGRARNVKNLFIVDGSIFPTSGSLNASSTIQALALYVAEGLKNSARHLLD